MDSIKPQYVPGVCNIGPQEISRRRNLGWGGFIFAIILLAILVWLGANHWWRLLIFFPAMLSASGFLQAYFHFCSGFARRGLFNFGEVGETQKVSDEASKAQDRSKGNKIALYATIIGVAAAVICVLI